MKLYSLLNLAKKKQQYYIKAVQPVQAIRQCPNSEIISAKIRVLGFRFWRECDERNCVSYLDSSI